MSAKPWCYLDAPDLDRLDLASVLVREALGTPYLVGSCLERADFRDVDIRVILTDKRYRRLFERPARDPLRHIVQVAMTEHYTRAVPGLRIDFQIQSMTSTAKYPGVRHPLGIYPR